MILKAGIRHFLKHPVQLWLCFSGIMLGVALSVSIDLANSSAVQNFESAAEVVGGKSAFHLRSKSEKSIPDSLYVRLRLNGERAISPILEEEVLHETLGELTFFGIDPFADAGFRAFQTRGMSSISDFIASEGTFYCEVGFAAEKGWTPGFVFQLPGSDHVWTLKGTFEASSDFEKKLLRGFLLADIHSVQNAFSLPEKLSRIDILDAESAERIQKMIPSEFVVVSASERAESGKVMTEAFRLNLAALSKLGLLVSVLLVFQASGFSVIQRKRLFSRLFVMGFTRRQIVWQVLAEAFVLGSLASAAGAVLGGLIASKIIPLIGATLTTFFDAPEAPPVFWNASVLLVSALSGIAATLIGAAVPAYRAGKSAHRDNSEAHILDQKAPARFAAFGFFGLLFALLMFFLVPKSLEMVYGVLLLILMSVFSFFPLLMQLAARFFVKGSSGNPGVGTLGTRAVFLQPGGVLAALIAITMALGMFLGVSVMVKSFRNTVIVWLDSVLKADIYVSANNFSLSGSRVSLSPEQIDLIEHIPDILSIGFVANGSAKTGGQTVDFQIITVAEGRSPAQSVKIALPDWQSKYQSGSHALISEPLANRMNVKPGDSLQVDAGNASFMVPVAAVYYDYASVRGSVSLSRTGAELQNVFWKPDGASVFLRNPDRADIVAGELSVQLANLTQEPTAGVQSNKGLLEQSVAVFDRTFLITGFLRWIIGFVAALGVTGALVSRILEKNRTFGLLKAIGFTSAQLSRLVFMEAVLIGGLGTLLALPVGLGFAWVLVEVINTVSFGWSLSWSIGISDILTVIALGGAASVFAGTVPAVLIRRSDVNDQLREE